MARQLRYAVADPSYNGKTATVYSCGPIIQWQDSYRIQLQTQHTMVRQLRYTAADPSYSGKTATVYTAAGVHFGTFVFQAENPAQWLARILRLRQRWVGLCLWAGTTFNIILKSSLPIGLCALYKGEIARQPPSFTKVQTGNGWVVCGTGMAWEQWSPTPTGRALIAAAKLILILMMKMVMRMTMILITLMMTTMMMMMRVVVVLVMVVVVVVVVVVMIL